MRLFTHDYEYVIITGATGSGKSSLVEKLVSDYDMDYRKKFTTRPPRPGESDLEYIRVTHETMDLLDEQKLLASRICPNTAHGIWEYGIPVYNRSIYSDRTLVQVLGLNDIENLINIHQSDWFPHNSLLVILYVDKETLLSKLKETRNDDEESIRRIESDINILGETPQSETSFQKAIHNMYAHNTQFKVMNIINHNFRYSVTDLICNLQTYQRNIFYNRQFTL